MMAPDWGGENLWHQTAAIWPVGVPCSLTWYDIGAIMHVIQAAHITMVVEIGVDQGGLAALLLAYQGYAARQYGHPPMIGYLGVEIATNNICPTVISPHRAQFYEGDAWAQSTVERVRLAVDRSERSLIFCDGGDKPRDMRTYAPIIRPGDVLMAHDYHNEYGDAELVGLPDNLERQYPPWLEQTLCCLFVKT